MKDSDISTVACAPRKCVLNPRPSPCRAVIADMLGLHMNTATRWVELAGAKWTGYVAARPKMWLGSPR